MNGPLTSHCTHEEQAWSSIKRKGESLGHPSEPSPLSGTTECWPLHPLHDSVIPWKTSQSCLSFLTAAASQPTFPPPSLPTGLNRVWNGPAVLLMDPLILGQSTSPSLPSQSFTLTSNFSTLKGLASPPHPPPHYPTSNQQHCTSPRPPAGLGPAFPRSMLWDQTTHSLTPAAPPQHFFSASLSCSLTPSPPSCSSTSAQPPFPQWMTQNLHHQGN